MRFPFGFQTEKTPSLSPLSEMIFGVTCRYWKIFLAGFLKSITCTYPLSPDTLMYVSHGLKHKLLIS